mmetsp:Transcript_24330/g.36083  ORF Transcript_24330/g.36083 Transcript_24330/m.36083 type:complete len:343 (+) Transcript_24330:193-1221(+)|eukprot:CAMPEP_0194221856 /NCGR_PEP_ID=MMETSP0156-20130528/31530_1 /TAXON_ID=33649 /ORGANISM="Thalassionema nitzschioides, Strain L26-B" /LENGTH=342 /DNA_ID=CAMNT_0038952407 /DNA_START=163 /DNA_END=1191 /DNA_ORIENTATION=+
MEENVEHQAEYLQLNDFQHYLNTRGLRDENAVGMSSELNLSETRQRLADEKAYQERIHQKVFGQPNEEETLRRNFLDTIDDANERNRIVLRSMDGTVESTVKKLASRCDAVYALAVHRDMYNRRQESDNQPKGMSQRPLTLSLEAYSQDAVEEFEKMIHGSKSPNSVSPDLIVECCQIAHYLQCALILNPLVEMLSDAVDTANCHSLLELADRLSLPSLFERSLSHMMKSLDETQDVWDDLNSELKDRISLMKEAIESSVLTGKSRLYFGSIQEYLAMFAETVQYHQERLCDAKERQAEEREAYLIRSNAWEHNQRFIDLQEKRVERLEVVMKKQKEMFSVR